ncbi:hypothetical protein RB594_004055 [Gaeumannomyces avenae]
MGIFNALPEGLDEVDVIIAGGGAAGCVVAGRLAAASPELSILVVEAGKDNTGNPMVEQPIMFWKNMDPAAMTSTFHDANKSGEALGRKIVIPSGGILGGGTSVNMMAYARPQRCDLDAWGIPGWAADDMLPYFKKFETYKGLGPDAVHGKTGPIQVSDGSFRNEELTADFIKAAGACGYPEIKDAQDMSSVNGTAPASRFISTSGARQDTASIYVHPLLRDGKHPNLHVLTEHNVVRVIFNGDKRASGVEVTPNPIHQEGSGGRMEIVRARKLVALSAGSYSTPLILERSGVGRADVLRRAGVPLVAEVPSVGENLQDHHITMWPYRSSFEAKTLGTELLVAPPEAVQKQDRRVGWNCQEAVCKVRPTDAEAAAIGPAFKARWDEYFAAEPTRPLASFIGIAGCIPLPPNGPPCEHILLSTFTCYPKSRGYVHITGPSVADKPDLDVAVLTDDGADLEAKVWVYKKGREVMRRLAHYRGEVQALHPAFPEGSAASLVTLAVTEPAPFDPAAGPVPDIAYSAEDDAAIAAQVRAMVAPTWHCLGTARMGAGVGDGAVDAQLDVFGVQGLKVADLSVVPGNVAGNTASLALAIGEKAADLMAKELGLV